MKLGVLTVPFAHKPLEEVLPYLQALGVEAVELGTGGVTDKSHCDPGPLLADPAKRRALKELLARHELELAALSCHGNALHPDRQRAEADHRAFVDAVALARELGVKTVVTFSGCPGDCETSRHPNWVTCPWPEDFLRVLDYQWNEVLIPYWRDAAKIAADAGVRVAIEMHPGFCVYNPETLLRLRAATGDVVGANFDPSHLFWQGIDAVAAIRELGDAIHHVHAKDCRVDAENTGKNGVLDTKHYGDERRRSWLFRTVGYGHDEALWNDIVSNLRLVGYDGCVSIEHEDSLMSTHEGLEKAVALLRRTIIRQPAAAMWWA